MGTVPGWGCLVFENSGKGSHGMAERCSHTSVLTHLVTNTRVNEKQGNFRMTQLEQTLEML